MTRRRAAARAAAGAGRRGARGAAAAGGARRARGGGLRGRAGAARSPPPRATCDLCGVGDGSGARPRVLLLGLGGAGHAALQLLAARGAHVVVGCAAELAPRALQLGAQLALDRHAPDYALQVQRAGPYYAAVDCAGLGGGAARDARWGAARWATLTSPLLRRTDARGLVAGALAAAGELARQQAGPGGPSVRWAYFAPCAADIDMIRKLAERGQVTIRPLSHERSLGS
ncbi:hypothetical protein ACJJTC_013479 [Scirpophaga incertulas]